MVNVYDTLRDWATKHQNTLFLFLAFAIPLVVRTIPEILMGPYIIGFDTMAFYVPNTLLWLHSGINWGNFLGTAPLFYSIFISIVDIGGSPVFTLKVISPLLLGFLGLSMYTYAKKGLGWSPIKSTFVAILGTVYFVALRASWDQLREELGLVFFFVVLTLIASRKSSSREHYLLLCIAMIAVAMSHQLISILMFGVVVFTIAYEMLRKAFRRSINLIVVSLPAVIISVVIYLNATLQSGFLNYSTNLVQILASWTDFASYQSMLASEGGFVLYCYLLLLPLIVIGLWRFENLQLRSWVLVSLILMLIPFASVSPFRWVLLLTYPFAFFATETLSWLKAIKWRRFKFAVRRIAILYLVFSTALLSFGFIFMTPENPFIYFNPQQFNSYLYQIPSSMQQNTISIIDCKRTMNSLQWFKDNENSSALLLTHAAFYSWALLVLNESQVKDYGFGYPVNAATTLFQTGISQIYLIWWVNEKGWYGQSTVPSSFQEIYQNGAIAIYRYSPS